MKKFIMGFISCFILMVGFSYAANNNIFSIAKFKILVNGNDYKGTKPAIVVDGSTYLPLRALGEVLNTKVNWNEVKRQVEIGEMPIEATPTPVTTPNPKVSVGKNEFIAHDNMQGWDIFKVSVLGKVTEGETVSGIKYEVWKFKFENIDIHEQDILPSQLGWNRGAIIRSVPAPEGYELIKQKKLKPGETWECVAVLDIKENRAPITFGYENGTIEYQE